MKKRVSIVVPVYNSHVTLPKCLDSLIAQTYQDLEIICVNDKSKDNSIDIIKEYQKKDSRVILVDHEENKNAGGARNSGIRTATGEYICFVDNDDWLTPDAIDILAKASDNGRVDFIVSQWCRYYTESKKENVQNLIVGGTKDENREYALLYGCRILGCLIRRDIFIKNNLFYPEKTFFEDNAIAMSLIFCANEISVVPQVLYYYQMLEGSSSRSISLIKIIDRIKTSELSVSNMERLGFVNEQNRPLIDYLYLCFSFHTIRMLASVGTKDSRKYLNIVSKRVKPLMPNKYILQYNPRFASTLTHPYFHYKIWKFAFDVKRILPKVIVSKIKQKIGF